MRLVVVGGGSAGHVIPARPVMQRFLDEGHSVDFVGTPSGLEQDLVADLAVGFYAIRAGKLRRYFSWQNLLDLGNILTGLLQSLILMAKLRPDVVFSKGGFVSFPLVFAAWLWRVPVVAHESDITPGLANRLVKPFVRSFCVTFADTQLTTRARVVHSGTPIRPDMLAGDPQRGRHMLPFAETAPIIVVTGGSLGADALNQVVRASLDRLTESHLVVHVVGPGKQVVVQHPRYCQFEYVNEGWGDILAAADVVVSRAGANALFELISLRKLSILVPLSKAVSRGDQIDNAAYAQRQNLAWVIQDEALTPDTLLNGVATVQAQRQELRHALEQVELPDATEVIYQELQNVTGSSI